MGKVYVAIMPAFYMGDSVVLVAADRDGIGDLEQVLILASRKRGKPSVWNSGTQSHVFAIEVEGQSVELHGDSVVWRLSDEKVRELVGKLKSLRSKRSGPGHHYVDITGPVETLILSRDKYLDLFNDDE